MQFKQAGMRTVVIGAALAAGMVAGTLGFGLASAGSGPNKSLAPAPVFPRNASGQTYGSGLDATSPATAPELIKAIGVDGTHGYLRSEDVFGVTPKTPQEALTQQRSRAGSVRQIPLYAVDGKTVIGTFNVYPGQGTAQQAKR